MPSSMGSIQVSDKERKKSATGTKEDRPAREKRKQDSVQLYKCRGECLCRRVG